MNITEISKITLENGRKIDRLKITWERFGQDPEVAPVVVVNHALTGNSDVLSWWPELIGSGKVIDLERFSVLAFNIPGNGFAGIDSDGLPDYTEVTARDVATIFWSALDRIGIRNLFALIGGSLGGGIAWEMAALRPDATQYLIPIATDWKASDWVIAQVQVQDRILNQSSRPVEDARQHAMLLYRTPLSLTQRFHRGKADGRFRVATWLDDHGLKLQQRFSLPAYLRMNHLLQTVDITRGRSGFAAVASGISAEIHLVAVDSDLFYIPEENIDTLETLLPHKPNVFYHEIESVHGHDAFLIESEQLSGILRPIFATSPTEQFAAIIAR